MSPQTSQPPDVACGSGSRRPALIACCERFGRCALSYSTGGARVRCMRDPLQELCFQKKRLFCEPLFTPGRERRKERREAEPPLMTWRRSLVGLQDVTAL